MITREELLKSSEYWIETIQNKIYNDLVQYIDENKIQGKDIAESLGLSKGRVSQILGGGNLNFRLETLVKLCLAINKIPEFKLSDMDSFILKDLQSYKSTVFIDTHTVQSELAQLITYPISYQHGVSYRISDEIIKAEVVNDVKERFTNTQKVA
jgi:predicted XRE-type DNA-binding protein